MNKQRLFAQKLACCGRLPCTRGLPEEVLHLTAEAEEAKGQGRMEQGVVGRGGPRDCRGHFEDHADL